VAAAQSLGLAAASVAVAAISLQAVSADGDGTEQGDNMTIKYREGEFGSLADNKDIGRTRAMVRLTRHLRKIGDSDYRIRKPGEKPGPLLGLGEAMDRIRTMTKVHNFPGYKVSVKSDSAGAVAYGLLLVEPEPDITNTPGNAYVDLVYTMVFAKFPQASNLGNCYCRKIDGSYSWSQHAFCNAQDFGAPSGSQFWLTLNSIANYIVANAVQFKTETVIVQDRIWLRGQGWHNYGGAYHYHVHTDGYPNGTGTPECAR